MHLWDITYFAKDDISKIPNLGMCHYSHPSIYTPNTVDNEEMVDEFYDQLQTATDTSPNNDMLIIKGDFIAKLAIDDTEWKDVIGHFGYGKSNMPEGRRP